MLQKIKVGMYFLSFRLLIGAPRARALGQQTANITGGLYKCEITQSNKCERIQFDSEGEFICLSGYTVLFPKVKY